MRASRIIDVLGTENNDEIPSIRCFTVLGLRLYIFGPMQCRFITLF